MLKSYSPHPIPFYDHPDLPPVHLRTASCQGQISLFSSSELGLDKTEPGAGRDNGAHCDGYPENLLSRGIRAAAFMEVA